MHCIGKVFVSLLIVGWFSQLSAQNHLPRFNEIDVQHYRFDLNLNDTTDVIRGAASIDIRFKDDRQSFYLDLVSFDDWTGKGMTVSRISSGSKKLKFEQEDDQLTIFLRKRVWKDEVHSFIIDYNGIPEEGLVIDKNKFGDRTFFGDNWPDRAKNWLPTVDHPSDKATVEFVVSAPSHYKVIGNGVEVGQEVLPDNYKKTHWKTDIPLPTKVMVFGASPFSVEEAGWVNSIPVTTWVFPQNESAGFHDFQPSVSILDYFIKKIGEYPYRKLANVQSKTRHGGMENASNIFYFEAAVTGKRERDFLIAHEVAHQWFGNSATEANWHHVWLSEGFATYMTNLYAEDTYGPSVFIARMQSQRQKVIDYSEVKLAPVIDRSIVDYEELLNANSYQKGSWILHMLRKSVGDKIFIEGIRAYYGQYKGSNALTSDFRRIMEIVSGKNLSAFFDQWLFKPGHPKLQFDWDQDKSSNKLTLTLDQVQEGIFRFPIEVQIIFDDDSSTLETLDIDEKLEEFIISVDSGVKDILIDPNTWLLFEPINN